MVATILPVLLIENDDRLRRSFLDYFRRHGLSIVEAVDIDDAEAVLSKTRVGMAILDGDIPGPDSALSCHRLRSAHPMLPIVLMTNRADLDSQLKGFTFGIDDYWQKPFPLSLAVAKSRALLRRLTVQPNSLDPFYLGSTLVDLHKRVIVRRGTVIPLKSKEHGILQILSAAESGPVRRDALLASVWGYNSVPVTRTVDNYIVSLRQKIEEDPRNPCYLITVGRVGYRLNRD
ncbi:MAG: response regulator transcription factor [Candidatus Kapabacteria bacterium]|nr:response regulator transcription factor [Candidatus Kapabacteria bacterium]